MIPGEMQVEEGEIEINQGRETITLEVANSGDRPVQVGTTQTFGAVDGLQVGEHRGTGVECGTWSRCFLKNL